MNLERKQSDKDLKIAVVAILKITNYNIILRCKYEHRHLKFPLLLIHLQKFDANIKCDAESQFGFKKVGQDLKFPAVTILLISWNLIFWDRHTIQKHLKCLLLLNYQWETRILYLFWCTKWFYRKKGVAQTLK